MIKIEVSESESDLIVRGLDLLLAAKRGAFRHATGNGNIAGFTQSDFGIPQIVNLKGKVGEATAMNDPDEIGVPS